MPNIFSKFFSSLSPKKGGGSVVGIDIGSSAIKVIQLRKESGRAILETYGSIALGPYDNGEVGQATNLDADKLVTALGELLKEANVTTKTNVAIAFPLKSSLLTVIELPAMDEKQIEKMIPIEARKYIPVPIGEVSLDWWVIPKRAPSADTLDGDIKHEPPKLEVLVAVVQNNIINKYKDVIKKTALEANFFEIETFSAVRSVMNRNELAPAVILDIGALTSKISIIDYGLVKVSHTVNRGSQDITMSLATSSNLKFAQAEDLKRKQGLEYILAQNKEISGTINSVVEYIFFETSRILKNYQQSQGRSVSQVVLIGGGALLKGLYDMATQFFEVKVVMGDPFARLETPAFLAPMLAEAGPEFAVAIGLALRELQEV